MVMNHPIYPGVTQLLPWLVPRYPCPICAITQKLWKKSSAELHCCVNTVCLLLKTFAIIWLHGIGLYRCYPETLEKMVNIFLFHCSFKNLRASMAIPLISSQTCPMVHKAERTKKVPLFLLVFLQEPGGDMWSSPPQKLGEIDWIEGHLVSVMGLENEPWHWYLSTLHPFYSEGYEQPFYCVCSILKHQLNLILMLRSCP